MQVQGESRWASAFQWLGASALALAGLFPVNNVDTFAHLAQGRQIVELGHVPTHDTWSLLPGPPRPWHNYEWLSDLLFYGLYSGFGYDGLLAFKCLLLFGTGWLLLSFARRLGGERAALLGALVLISALPAVRFRLSERPHVLGTCLAAGYLVLLSQLVDASGARAVRTRRRLVALLFVLHVAWVNLHGSHLLGVAITFAFCATSSRAARGPLFALLGLEALASCISPYGPAIVTDAVAHVADPRYRQIVSEWVPWDRSHPPWHQLGPALQGAVAVLVAPRLFRVSTGARAGLVVALMLGVASFRSVRFIGEFMLLSAPLVGAGLALRLAEVPFRRIAVATSITLAVLAWLVPTGAAHLPPYLPLGHGLSTAERPFGPGRVLARAKQTPRVFAAIEHSWPLMWPAPNARFFVDGRVPFYGPDHVAVAIRTFRDPALFDAVLHEDQVNAVVLAYTRTHELGLLSLMERRPAWSLVFVDETFALFVRDDLRAASGFPRLSELRPTYAPSWLCGVSPERRQAIERELALLAGQPTADAYRSWVGALLELDPLRRSGEKGGFRWPRGPQDWARYRRASALLEEAARGAGDMQVVSVHRALVEATLCRLDTAEASLERATQFSDQARDVLLTAQEIALRRGEREGVAALVTAGLNHPEGRGDPWLHELHRGLSSPPSCPP